MANNELEELVVRSDISDGFSSGDNSDNDKGLSMEPIRGVRDGVLPPFVTNLYGVVNNKTTDSTISWVSNLNLVGETENQVSRGATSFAIWNEKDFVNNILPLMSKSKNFDSFITQLNNYGFKKISWDRREYANEWFQEGKPHLLKNIKRRRKRNASVTEKLELEIKKLESESKELDHELQTFIKCMDDALSKQQKLMQVLKKSYQMIHQNKGNVLTRSHETNVLGESSFTSNYKTQNEEANKN